MINFMTEREMEDLLVSERRELVSSGGDRQVVTADRLFWLRLDLLLQAFITTLPIWTWQLKTRHSPIPLKLLLSI